MDVNYDGYPPDYDSGFELIFLRRDLLGGRRREIHSMIYDRQLIQVLVDISNFFSTYNAGQQKNGKKLKNQKLMTVPSGIFVSY